MIDDINNKQTQQENLPVDTNEDSGNNKKKAKGKWPKWRIIKWIANFMVCITIIICGYCAYLLCHDGPIAWEETESLANRMTLPDDLQPFGLKTALTIWKDSWEHDYEKYNTALYTRMKEANQNHDNYSAAFAYSPEINIMTTENSPYIFYFTSFFDVNGPLKKGSMGLIIIPDPDSELCLDIPFYQVTNNNQYTTYFQFDGQWYKTTSDDEGAILSLSPERICNLADGQEFINEPFGFYLDVDSCEINDPLFNLWNTNYCGFSDTALFSFNKDYTLKTFSLGMEISFDMNETISFAEEHDDPLLLYLVETYDLQNSFAPCGFTDYGEVEPIVLPKELENAIPLTQEAKYDIIDSVINKIELRLQYFKECGLLRDDSEASLKEVTNNE